MEIYPDAYLDLSYQIQYGSWLYGYYFKTLSVTDTVHIENKKFFRVNGFFDFPDGTILRYDNDSSRIIIYRNNVEYIYMDFSLPNSSIITLKFSLMEHLNQLLSCQVQR